MTTWSGLDRLRSIIVQRLTHEALEELKDTTLWVRFANSNYFGEYELKDLCEQKMSSFYKEKLRSDWSKQRNGLAFSPLMEAQL